LRAQIAVEAEALEREIALESDNQDLVTAASVALAGARGDIGTASPHQDRAAPLGRSGSR